MTIVCDSHNCTSSAGHVHMLCVNGVCLPHTVQITVYCLSQLAVQKRIFDLALLVCTFS